MSVGIEITDGGSWSRADIAAVTQQLERAGVHYWVLGADRGDPVADSRESLDPSLVATVAARHSTELGLVIAAAAHRDHPYNLARRLLSVDHAAQGRVGWLALDGDHRIGLDTTVDAWTGGALDAGHTAEAVAAVRTLWRTWPLDSVLGDRATGVFTDASRIRRADVRGGGYSIAGPLNLPGSTQGDLPVWQHAGPAVRDADLAVIEEAEPVPGWPAVVRLRAVDDIVPNLERLARTPNAVGVLLRLTADDLDEVLGELVPDARRRGLLALPRRGTLRRRLRLPLPTSPDLSTHRLAFAGAPNAGGRL
jgi:alkanesulfonate monooxygenase SsuD/methylene tetrahydromethanopterin reductase-like flavin-dependent oxidoreductase (luciferase family)